MERGIRKCLTFVIRPIASKFSEKYYSSPYNIEKTQVPLEKVFSMYLEGNCRWVPLQTGFLAQA